MHNRIIYQWMLIDRFIRALDSLQDGLLFEEWESDEKWVLQKRIGQPIWSEL